MTIAFAARSPATSCRWVWSDLRYFARKCTIATMQILLHDSHHVQKTGRWGFNECNFIFIVIIIQFIPLHHCLINALTTAHFSGILDGRLSGFDGDVSPSPSKMPDWTISQDTLYNLNELNHKRRVLAVGITMIVWQQKESDGIICLPEEGKSYVDMLVVDRKHKRYKWCTSTSDAVVILMN
jgi:hypothetical protein